MYKRQRQLSAFVAIVIAVLVTIGYYIIHPNLLYAIGSLVVIAVCCYFLILYFLQKFIYNKIKTIYRLIYQTKATKREEFYYRNILPRKGIDEVREDVEQWATQRNLEIDNLKRNEQFRREFLQNLSHELKTPLFAIQGYVQTLQDGALYNNDVNVKFLDSANKNVIRLVDLVESLDEISKLESGIIEIKYSNFNIQDLIKEVFDLVAMKHNNKPIIFGFKKNTGPASTTVYADKNKIKQVLTNLVDNAVKYSKEEGTIEASVYTIEDDLVLVEISDTGNGIPAEHIGRVFERFYRTDSARNRGIGGSGLGLSISKHIIEAHHQNIHARSKVGVGSTFGFTLQKGHA